MIINPKDLPADTLDGILESFIARDGTDYGEVETSLTQKLAMLRPQIVDGDVLILFDPVTEEINLVTKHEYEQLMK